MKEAAGNKFLHAGWVLSVSGEGGFPGFSPLFYISMSPLLSSVLRFPIRGLPEGLVPRGRSIDATGKGLAEILCAFSFHFQGLDSDFSPGSNTRPAVSYPLRILEQVCVTPSDQVVLITNHLIPS